MSIVACCFLAVWLIGGLFVGIGGLVKLNADEAIENINKKKDDLLKRPMDPIKTEKGLTITDQYMYAIYNEQEGLERYFEWTIVLPKFAALVITAMSFGLLGGLVNIFKDLATGKTPISEARYVTMPVLGILTGLVVLGLTYVLPTALTKDTGEIRPLTLVFLCLFCGITTEKFYAKIDSFFDKLITGK